ncbi:MAG: ATP-binding cassette domain-containing protein [Chitinispirillaceae bacterium]|nr:ATP-binding cassette domain-containing protein [Chitinispirillaceae bacterium]
MPGNIELRDVTFSYGVLPVLRSITVSATRGEIVLVSGRSGHGLSTLLELCVGLQQPRSGSVLWDGRDLIGYTKTRLLNERRSIGYLFQTGALISNFTVFENIALPLRNHGRMSEKEIHARVHEEMEGLMLVNADHQYPEALSVFQNKAVALARALIGKPDLLLLDDPVGGVDVETALGLLNVIEARWKKEAMGIIMITHDIGLWPHLPVHRFFLENGGLSPVSRPVAS